ncbi:MAG: tRNA lysidine(34) synthetase TilS [bacterium]
MIALNQLLRQNKSVDTADSPSKITVLHFNHRLHPDSDQWQHNSEFCCQRLGIPFQFKQWDNLSGRMVNEAEARRARYEWFMQVVETNQVLLTAHHADDQAETVLMHLFQGRGASRLTGIPSIRPLTYGDRRQVCRPLLGFSRESLQDYLQIQNQRWIDDPANQDQRFNRNFIRAQIMPLVKRRWPMALQSISTSAADLAEIISLLNRNLEQSLALMLEPDAARVFCLAPPLKIHKLKGRTRFEFCHLLRHWIHQAGVGAPTDAQLKVLYNQIQERQVDSVAGDNKTKFTSCKVHWKRLNIVSYDGHLFLIRDQMKPNLTGIKCKLEQSKLFSGLVVCFREVTGIGLSPDLVASGELNWRWRKGGEKVNLPGRRHRSSLKKLLQQHRVPEWEREALPHLECKGEIVWVHGVGVAKDYAFSGNRRASVLPRFSKEVLVE